MDVQAVFAVLSVTSILVLLTLGLGVIAGMMGILNMAQGEFVLLGAVTVYITTRAGLPLLLGVVLAPVVLGVFGAVVERLIVRRLYGRTLSAILATWALALALAIRGVVLQTLGSTARSVAYPVDGTVVLLGSSVHIWRLIIIATTALVVVVLLALLRWSAAGLKARAVLENPEYASVAGLPTRAIFTGVFALGSALAGLAGAMIVPLSSLYAELGVTYLVRSFLGLVIGGLGTLGGAILGAGIVGGVESALSFWIQPTLSEAVVFTLAILVMRFRPQGLRGTR